MDKKKYKEEVEQAALFIEVLKPHVALAFDKIHVFENALKKMKEMESSVVSAAAIIGPKYEERQLDIKFRRVRLEGVVKLLHAFKESEEIFKKLNDAKMGNKQREQLFAGLGLS